MWELITAGENLPFAVALAMMFMLACLEGVGMLLGAGLSEFFDSVAPDLDVDLDVDAPDVSSPGAISQVMGWLSVGKVPFVVFLVLALTFFGILGLMGQSIVHQITGAYLPAWIASIAAIPLSLYPVRWSGALIGRVMPKDETEAVSSDSFIGRVATITLGKATHDASAQARLKDEHGHTHYVMLRPQGESEVFEQGCQVLLVQKTAQGEFLGIGNPNPALVDD